MDDFKSKIQMVDLNGQYHKIKKEIDLEIFDTIEQSQFIKGQKFEDFQVQLAEYLKIRKVIGCGNGTDALQIALMALDLKKGDEIIVPAFTYVATAEVIALLGLTPVLVDVDYSTFNISINSILSALSPKTKVIVPVHLFGQCADMESILNIAQENNIYVIEDSAQSLGSTLKFKNGINKKAGTLGHIGCTSFFPSKNLGCFGDGGAIFTDNSDLGSKLEMIANHGQSKKYFHDIVGVNSRLDTLQASILKVKLKYLDNFNLARNNVAKQYDSILGDIDGLEIPERAEYSTHVFNQYTIIVKDNKRNNLKSYLNSHNIPSMIYYPMPLNKQKAFIDISKVVGNLENSNILCEQVLSLPMHTELTEDQINYISEKITSFYK